MPPAAPTLVVILPCLVMPTGGSKDVERCIHAAQAAGWDVVAIVGAPDRCPLDRPFARPVPRLVQPALFRFSGFGRLVMRLAEHRCQQTIRALAQRGPVVVWVEGDRPRTWYLRLQREVPVLFAVRDNSLTCPAGTRWLPRSERICTEPCGPACQALHRSEGCLGKRGFVARWKRIARRVAEMRVIGQYRHLVANSRYTATIHRRSDATVLYPPIDTPPALDVARQPRRLLYVGRLQAIKGVADALAACATLGAGWTLDIIGDGPERAELERRASAPDLAGRVRFLGWIAQEQVLGHLAAAAIVLVPSRWDEAFCRVGPEAFSVGTPVVAYAVGGIPEWCRPPAGRCVTAGDRDALVAACRELDEPATWQTAHAAALQSWHDFATSRLAEGFQRLLTSLTPAQP